MDQKHPITKNGFDALEEELKHLKTHERPKVIKAIAEAREHGDLSENAEYHSAKDRQGMIEARISYLENKINMSEVIHINKGEAASKVIFGATVTLQDEDHGDRIKKYQLVGSDEANIEKNLLSITSPLGRALIGKEVGESVEVTTPVGPMYYTIKNIELI
ncbi:MAG: transcription elongation factor GreA [Alphaproteobacteria bacterium]|nr:MAG: transcription elongation factor GreA [Alphaproteobacteria bacterium]